MIVVRLTPEPAPATPKPATEIPEAEDDVPVDPVTPAPSKTGARKSGKTAKPGKTTSPKSDVIEKNPF